MSVPIYLLKKIGTRLKQSGLSRKIRDRWSLCFTCVSIKPSISVSSMIRTLHSRKSLCSSSHNTVCNSLYIISVVSKQDIFGFILLFEYNYVTGLILWIWEVGNINHNHVQCLSSSEGKLRCTLHCRSKQPVYIPAELDTEPSYMLTYPVSTKYNIKIWQLEPTSLFIIPILPK